MFIQLNNLVIEFYAGTFYIGGPDGPGCFIEVRPRDWSRHWSYQREPGSFEVWAGRLYACVSRPIKSASVTTS